MTESHHGSDMKAAFTGLILGAIALLIVVVTIVKLTNHKYASETPAAEATH
ncbi:MAG TPA: hypothetical protein VIV65_02800 [Gemmatimonadaceae bacterium]|jgi:hypothetical protein